MNLGDIKSFAVVCGAGLVRYRLNEEGEFRIYVGPYIHCAPPEATETRILDGYTTFILQQEVK